jgi:hypothetical protein
LQVVLLLVFLAALELQRTDADILDKLKKSKDIKDPTPAPTPAPQTVIVTKKVYVPYPVHQPKQNYGHKHGGYGGYGFGGHPQGGNRQYGGRPYGYGP